MCVCKTQRGDRMHNGWKFIVLLKIGTRYAPTKSCPVFFRISFVQKKQREQQKKKELFNVQTVEAKKKESHYVYE